MTLRHVEGGLDKFTQDPDPLKANLATGLVAGARRWLELYPDVPLPGQILTSGTEQTLAPRTDLLAQAIKEKLSTPELVTSFWRTKLQADGKRAGIDIVVPDCDWSAEAIQRPMIDKDGNLILGMLVPALDELTLPLLGRMYPLMRSYAVAENTPITDTHETRGYIKVYASVDAPNRDTTQTQLEEFARKQGYIGARLRTYILASQASKDFTGKYLDQEDTSSKLLGSLRGGGVLSAYFRPDGFLDVIWGLGPEGHGSRLGGRFEEVKKA